MKYFAKILIPLLLVSCNDETSVPGNMLQPEVMTNILTEQHLAEATNIHQGLTKADSRQKAIDYYEGIYKKYNTDSVSFRKSWEYYCQHPALYDMVQEDVVERLNKLQMNEGK